ncbi:hypothetical protein [Streptomyces sp. HC307]|uniref:hypothetical protein n=1 Tax=Streptomyces flavusporus TaxID=3385496 RepID=UPI003916E834
MFAGFLFSHGSQGIDFVWVAAFLLGGLVAAPIAAWLVRLLPPRGTLRSDSVVMLFDAKDGWPDTPALLRLYVEDADVNHRKAPTTGALGVTETTELYFGDLGGRVRDP